MYLDYFGPRFSWFALLAIYLGCALLLSGCADRPPPGQAPTTPGTAATGPNPPPAISSMTPTRTQVATSNPISEESRQQAFRRLPTLYKLPGTVIAQGQTATPMGIYHLKGYTIERVDLAQPTLFAATVPGQGSDPLHTEFLTVDRFWRVSVIAEPRTFVMTDLSWLIWVNDTLLGWGVGTEDKIMVAVFDRQLLPEGASIAVSFGESRPQEAIPERIHYTQKP